MIKLSDSCPKPNRSPAQRVRFGKEEQRRERALTFAKKIGASDTKLAPTCLLLPKKIQPGKPCGSMDSGFFATCVFVFLRFFKPFPNPHIDILTKPCANRIRKKGHASAQPSFLLQSYDLLI